LIGFTRRWIEFSKYFLEFLEVDVQVTCTLLHRKELLAEVDRLVLGHEAFVE
jgi:hypothetical protein